MLGCEIDHTPKLFAGKDGATAEELKIWTALHDAKWPGIPGAKKRPITADSDRPETISYMNRHGFNITPAIKGTGSRKAITAFRRQEDGVS
jgi:phage terminase large subunit